jgi:DNA end-binding protein Ku
MPAHPSWTGYLKLSLVSCAVELFPASTRSEKISFHILNRETGNRVRQLLVDEKTKKPVDEEDRVKGYEARKRKYILVEDEELDAIEIESTRTMEIESFAHAGEIDPLYFSSAHYLVPEDKVAEEAFSDIRDAMKDNKVVGIARVVLHQRERVMMLEPRGSGIFSVTLRYGYEIRKDAPYFDKIKRIKVPAEMREIAGDIIARKTRKFDPGRYEDRYENALAELLKAKKAGRKLSRKKIAKPKSSSNLMDALKKSLSNDGKSRKPAQRSSAGQASRGTRRKPARARRRA